MLAMGLSLVGPVQAQTPDLSGTLSGISGITAPEKATGVTVETLCPKLSPTATGGVGDLQIRCTEMIGNAKAGNTSAASAPLLPLAPEEIAGQARSAVETSNRNIGTRLATLRGGVTNLGFRRFALQNDAPAVPYTLVASLAPFAASSVVAASTPSNFSRLGLFANGTFTGGDKDVSGQEAGFDYTTFGLTLGTDYRFTDNFVLGATFNYLSNNIDFDTTAINNTQSGGGIDTQSFGFSLYSTYYVSNQFYVDGIFSFGRNNYDIDRRIIYSIPSTTRAGALIVPGTTTTVNQTATGDTNSTQYSISVGVGYDFYVQGFTVTPLARLEYSRLNIDGYQETINNTADGFGLALAFNDQHVDSLVSVLGGQASYAISTGIGVLLPQLRVEWRHEFENDARTLTSRFVNDPARTPLVLGTDNPDRDFFTLGTSLSATFRGGVAAFVSYETVVGLVRVTAHSVVGGIRFEF
jgi:uncharacterized protein with beta-barrel porin domain